jgi:hypothetical protein
VAVGTILERVVEKARNIVGFSTRLELAWICSVAASGREQRVEPQE